MNRIVLTALFLLGSIIVSSQNGNSSFAIGERVSFESKNLDEERNILVYLPPTYNFSETKYPVLYLLDGGVHFHHASGIAQFLSAQGLMPQTIVVAVVNTDRNKDFTPTKLSQQPQSGGAEKFAAFFTQELFPFVERNYRPSSYKILMGHSLGGTFATFVLLNHPEMFNAFISVSPFLMYDNNLMVRETEKKLKKKYNNVKFFMTLGNEPPYFEALDYFAKTIETRSPKGFEFEYSKYLDDNHGSVPHPSIYNGLLFIFSTWKLQVETFKQGLAAIDKHYKKLSKEFESNIKTPENTINLLGYSYLHNNDFGIAIEIFKENVKRFPKSANVYDSLGEAYEKSGDNKSARDEYEKAVDIATKNGYPNLEIYKNNLNRVTAQF